MPWHDTPFLEHITQSFFVHRVLMLLFCLSSRPVVGCAVHPDHRNQYCLKGSRRFDRPLLCSKPSSADETNCGKKAFLSSLKSSRASLTDVASILRGLDVLCATGLLPWDSPQNDGSLSNLSNTGSATDDGAAPDLATQDIVIMGFVLRGALP